MPSAEWNEANQLVGIRTTATNLKDAGVDTWWIDAGYNVGGFPGGQGNWSADPSRFPNGSLSKVGAAAKEAGLRLLVWFEPERVMPGTELAKISSFLSPPPVGLPPQLAYQQTWRLLNLGDPNAFSSALDTLSGYIDQGAVQCFDTPLQCFPPKVVV